MANDPRPLVLALHWTQGISIVDFPSKGVFLRALFVWHKLSNIFAFHLGELVRTIGSLFLALQFAPTVEERRGEISSGAFSGAASVPDQSNNSSGNIFDKGALAVRKRCLFSAQSTFAQGVLSFTSKTSFTFGDDELWSFCVTGHGITSELQFPLLCRPETPNDPLHLSRRSLL